MGFDFKKILKPIQDITDKFWAFTTKSASIFIALLFVIFSLGAIYGYIIALHSFFIPSIILLLIIPPGLGLIAYYNRAFATILFILLLIFIFI